MDHGGWTAIDPPGAGPPPIYACAILRTFAGGYLLEVRPGDARHGAGTWTCFGGKREDGERAIDAIEREILEELGVEIRGFEAAVALWVGGEPMAWFFTAREPVDPWAMSFPEGHLWIEVAAEDLERGEIHRWHRAAIRAARDGVDRVDFRE